MGDLQHQISFDVTGSPSKTWPATSKLTNCECTCWVTPHRIGGRLSPGKWRVDVHQAMWV
jgi:hypothetical protein